MKTTFSDQFQTLSVLSGQPVFEKDGDYVRVCIDGEWLTGPEFFQTLFKLSRNGIWPYRNSPRGHTFEALVKAIKSSEGETMEEKMNAFIDEIEQGFAAALNS